MSETSNSRIHGSMQKEDLKINLFTMLIRHTYQFNHINTVILTGLHVMVFNATFNNISVISSQSVLLVEETGVPGENHRPATSH